MSAVRQPGGETRTLASKSADTPVRHTPTLTRKEPHTGERDGDTTQKRDRDTPGTYDSQYI